MLSKNSHNSEAMIFPRDESIAFDNLAFDEAIRAHGPVFIHWQAMPDPLGLLSKFDSRRPDAVNNNKAFNGWYYVKRGSVAAALTGSSKEAKATNGGMIDAGTAQFTPATTYLNCDSRVYLSPNDRLYLEEESILVPRGELVEASMDGLDTLSFPAEQILAIVDADGVEYGPESYDIVQGKIQWRVSSPRPSFNIEENKGKVYSIKYLLRPFYYVGRLLHELRVIQFVDDLGSRKMAQVNQSAIVHREYLFQNKSKDESDPNQVGATERPSR
jgi:hypothetical protein